MEKKNAAAFGLVGLAVGLLVGYGAGRVSTGTPVNPLAPNHGSFQEGFDAARKKLAASGAFAPVPTEARVLNGTAKSVSGNTLTFEAQLTTSNPLEEIDAPKERRATVTTATKIYRLIPKTAEEVAAESDRPLLDEEGRPLPPPSHMRQETIALADITAGEQVTVGAAGDILRAESFEATEIAIAPPATALFTKPTPPPVPPPVP